MKISVIIPCFNVELYLNRSISSVLAQSYQNFEIILIDDGSTDSTASIIKQFAEEDSRIIAFTKNNAGVSSARNMGLRHASGELIYFLDADDYIEGHLFQKTVVSFRDLNSLDLISFGYDIHSENQIRLFSCSKCNKQIFNNNRFLEYFFKKKIRQSICSLIFRRDLAIKNDILFNEKTYSGEDQEFQIRLICSSRNILYLSDILFHYAIRPNSSVSQQINEKRITLLDAMERSYDFLESLGSSRKLLRSARLYLAIVYVYIYKMYLKSDTKTIPNIKKVLDNKSYMLKQKLGFSFSKYYVMVLLIRLIYRVHPKLLKFIF